MGIYLNREDKNFRIGGKNILPFYSERISDWINDGERRQGPWNWFPKKVEKHGRAKSLSPG